MMKRSLFILGTACFVLTACSMPSLDEVLSDNRTDYEKSQSLPPLDVPPDLRANEPNDSMTIPGETTSASAREYQNRNNNPQVTPAPVTTATIPVQEAPVVQTSTAAAGSDTAQGAFVVVRGDKEGAWNRLRSFLTGKGYLLELDDYELGYLETDWSVPMSAGGQTYREKFKLYAEAGVDEAVTVFYIENVIQVQAFQNNVTTWVDQGRDAQSERAMAGEMNTFFNGGQTQMLASAATAPVTTTVEPVAATSAAMQARAEIQNIGDNKLLLAIPEEYTLAWRRTEQALHMAGMTIKTKDQNKGLYEVTYAVEGAAEGGWLKKLKFWGSDGEEGKPYQIALTGVGNQTELVLLDEKGDWEDPEITQNILTMLQDYYNRLM